MIFDNSTSAVLQPVFGTSAISGNTYVKAQNGKLSWGSLVITAQPGSAITVQISAQASDQRVPAVVLEFVIKFRGCISGEVINNGLECKL